jgi:hypothetical protein
MVIIIIRTTIITTTTTTSQPRTSPSYAVPGANQLARTPFLPQILASGVFGLTAVYDAYAAAGSGARTAVLVSSALWAMGTVLFGVGVDLSGVAMGVGLGEEATHDGI